MHSKGTEGKKQQKKPVKTKKRKTNNAVKREENLLKWGSPRDEEKPFEFADYGVLVSWNRCADVHGSYLNLF